jgi:hypothetical protein
MPCYDERDSAGWYERNISSPEIARLKDRNNKLTRLLCEACSNLGRDYMSTELLQWWDEHRDLDQKRKSKK